MSSQAFRANIYEKSIIRKGKIYLSLSQPIQRMRLPRARPCSARLQAGTVVSSDCPPEDGCDKKVWNSSSYAPLACDAILLPLS
jgi:hypothetical protein